MMQLQLPHELKDQIDNCEEASDKQNSCKQTLYSLQCLLGSGLEEDRIFAEVGPYFSCLGQYRNFVPQICTHSLPACTESDYFARRLGSQDAGRVVRHVSRRCNMWKLLYSKPRIHGGCHLRASVDWQIPCNNGCQM